MVSMIMKSKKSNLLTCSLCCWRHKQLEERRRGKMWKQSWTRSLSLCVCVLFVLVVAIIGMFVGKAMK
jgi:hypothetical protein